MRGAFNANKCVVGNQNASVRRFSAYPLGFDELAAIGHGIASLP
jgi:hypothetical protein